MANRRELIHAMIREKKQKINPLDLRILMLKKGLTGKHLARRFRVGRSAISMALAGERQTLLARIYRYVKKYTNHK